MIGAERTNHCRSARALKMLDMQSSLKAAVYSYSSNTAMERTFHSFCSVSIQALFGDSAMVDETSCKQPCFYRQQS